MLPPLSAEGVIVVLNVNLFLQQDIWCAFQVLCEKAQLSVDNKGVNLVSTGNEKGTLLAPPEENFMNRYPEAYRNELDHFLDVVVGKGKKNLLFMF